MKIEPIKKDGEIKTGCGYKFTSAGVEINFISNCDVSFRVDDAVRATCEILVENVEIDNAVLKINNIETTDEILYALKDYFDVNRLFNKIEYLESELRRLTNETR